MRALYVSIIRWLAQDACVPVDTTDLSGSTALMWSISTKPYLDTDIADILLAVGGDINHRNRYGCVAAADIVMARDFTPAGKKKTCDALKYFLAKGGDIDIADGDGITPRRMAVSVQRFMPEIGVVLGSFSSNAGSRVGLDSDSITANSNTASGKKLGRNDPCICGKGKKYKVCCGKP